MNKLPFVVQYRSNVINVFVLESLHDVSDLNGLIVPANKGDNEHKNSDLLYGWQNEIMTK